MKVSFIIVNYNTKDLLRDCVNNLLWLAIKNYEKEIIVVDNGSKDGSADMVDQEFSDKVILIRNENKGLSHGHNRGLEKSTGDVLVYLGTDAYPKPEAMEKILEYLKDNPDTGVLTPKLILRDGSLDMDAHRGRLDPWVALTHWSGLGKIFPKSKLFNKYYLGYKDFNQPHEIDVCISHFMVIPRKVHDDIGIWDENYFLYGEDLDICYRAQKAGYKVIYLGNVEVLHYKGAGVGRKSTSDLQNASRSDKKHLKSIRRETTKAMKYYYNKHLAKGYPFLLNWLVYLGIFLMDLLRSTLYLLKGSGY